MKLRKPAKIDLASLILFLVILEIVIGGGGRVFPVYHGLTLRMFFFIVLVPISIIDTILKRNMLRELLVLIVIQFVLLSMSILNGFLHGANIGLIQADVKQQLYFFMILYFYNSFKSIDRVNLFIKTLKFATLFLAIAYLIIQLLIYFNLLDFHVIYNVLNDPNLFKEFRFRGNKGFFFYKSFIYMDIGLIFYILLNKSKKLYPLIILLAIYFTYMRGLIIVLAILFLLHIFIKKSGKVNTWQLLIVLAGVMLFIIYSYTFTGAIGSKASDVRLLQIIQVFKEINPFSLIFGHGFGVGVDIRPVHMEITYLELFHKQGIIGISFWFYILFILIRDFLRIKDKFQEAYPLFLGVLIVFLVSITNPFLINSIGMSYLLITYSIYKFFIKHDISLYTNI